MMSRANNLPPDLVLQPDKCKRCTYGSWRETRQYCPFQKCVKEDDAIVTTTRKLDGSKDASARRPGAEE